MMFLPATLLFGYFSLFEFVPGQQLFYIAVDSLFLVVYATVLIVVTLTRREQVMNPRVLFEWGEICRCFVESDEELMYDEEEECLRNPGSRDRTKMLQAHEQLRSK